MHTHTRREDVGDALREFRCKGNAARYAELCLIARLYVVHVYDGRAGARWCARLGHRTGHVCVYSSL